jgi:hypothetical protein
MTQLVFLDELAAEWGVDRSHARKTAIRFGADFQRVRRYEARGQFCLGLTREEADRIRRARRAEFGLDMVAPVEPQRELPEVSPHFVITVGACQPVVEGSSTGIWTVR